MFSRKLEINYMFLFFYRLRKHEKLEVRTYIYIYT